MAEMSMYACCRENPAPGTGADQPGPHLFAVAVGKAPPSQHNLAGPVVEPRRQMAAPSRRVATHEASHAVAVIALGGVGRKVTVEGQPHAASGDDLGLVADIAVSLAGPAGEAWAQSRIERLDDAALDGWIAAIRLIKGGFCDRCQAVRGAVIQTRDAPEMTAHTFRYAEQVAGIIVRSPPGWSAICEVADALLEHGTLTGDEVAEISRRHFEPGFMKIEEAN